MEYREVAEEAGIHGFHRVPALNTDPTFIEDLADMVMESIDAPKISLESIFHPPERTKLYPQERWEWGLTTAAEVWNGRLAMVGFFALLIELVTGRGLLHSLGVM
jgi:protoporphyrin/coproporphyrin ferrochelatase